MPDTPQHEPPHSRDTEVGPLRDSIQWRATEAKLPVDVTPHAARPSSSMHQRATEMGAPIDLEVRQILGHVQGDLFGDPGLSSCRYEIVRKLGVGGMGVVYEAYDPVLDCRVALKQLRPEMAVKPGLLDRLRREARAMARLRSEPRVVTLYDFFVQQELVFVVMEFVDGVTLREWQATSHPWSEILDRYLEAGLGLAAAHRAGLVHRDFKPDNVMVGRDGGVRVMDFGLARGGLGSRDEQARSLEDMGTGGMDASLTVDGDLVGTPLYMAPEQWKCESTDARTDQWSFCVALWEALYHTPPFVGATVEELVCKVVDGEPSSTPADSQVPPWLRRTLLRGLENAPERRWPDMNALLDAVAAELRRAQRRRQLRSGAVLLAGAIAVASGVEGYREWEVEQRVEHCEATGAAIDAEWNDDARLRLRDAFAATGRAYAATTAEKVMPWLDAHALAWKQARTDACLNADVRRVWDADTLDRSLWCLEDRWMDLTALADQLGRADATTVEKAVSAVTRMRSADSCLDVVALQRQPPPPTQGREAIAEVRQQLSRAHSLGRAGRFKEALVLASDARERAEALDEWPPLLAAARVQEGDFLERTGAYDEAEKVMTEAFFDATRASASETAVLAATNLLYTLGYKQARHADGRMWARHAEVAIALAGDGMSLEEANRLTYLGLVEAATGAYAEAQVLQERALAIRQDALGPSHPSIAGNLNNLANVHYARAEYSEARAQLERALAIQEQALGPDHPDVALTLTNLANVYYETGSYPASIALHQRAKVIDESTFGTDHPNVAVDLNNLAGVYYDMGDLASALPMYERTLAILEKALGSEHPEVAKTLGNLSRLHRSLGRDAEALALGERALALGEKALGPDHPGLVANLDNLANIHYDDEDYVRAKALYERGLAIREKALGPDHPEVGISLGNLANLHLVVDEPREALALAERAATIFAAHPDQQRRATELSFILAQALVAAHGDRDRALAEARRARDGFRAGSGSTQDLAAVEQWLAKHELARD